MISPLQLNNYFVEELSIKGNAAYSPSGADRHAGQIKCSVDYAKGIGAPDHFMITLTVIIEPSATSPALDPYHITAKVQGYFNFQPGAQISSEQMERMATLNGSSILFGLARGLVAQATGVGQFGKYLLPSVNFVEMLKKMNLDRQPAQHKAGRKRRMISPGVQ